MLQGAGFEAVDVSALSAPLGDEIIEWVTVEPDSSLAGATLGDVDVRDRTGASVIAIQRGGETVANPDPDVRVAAGDVLVALGSREEHAALEALAEAD
jgi:TrkA domain protein